MFLGYPQVSEVIRLMNYGAWGLVLIVVIVIIGGAIIEYLRGK